MPKVELDDDDKRLVASLQQHIEQHAAKVCERCQRPYGVHEVITIMTIVDAEGARCAAFALDTKNGTIALALCEDVEERVLH